MNRRLLVAGVSIFVLVLGSSSELRAGLVYDLVFDQPTYSGPTGGSVAVGLILRETATNPDVNLITNTNGVTTGNVRVNWDGGLAGAKVASVSDVANGTGFGPAGTTLTAVTDVLIDQLAFTPGVTGSQVSAGVREVSMGTLTFTLPSIPGITTINFSDPRVPPFDDLVVGSGMSAVAIDAIVSYGTATISAIPEPSAFFFLALAFTGTAAGYLMRFWSRSVSP